MFSIDTPKNILDYDEAGVLYLANKWNNSKMNISAKNRVVKGIASALGLQLSPDTQLALLADPKNKMLLAGPGAGKSTTIELEITNLKAFHYLRKKEILPGNRVLFISFSEASTEHVANRHISMINRVERSGIEGIKLSSDITAKTFHGFCRGWFEDYKAALGFKDANLEVDKNNLILRMEIIIEKLSKTYTFPHFHVGTLIDIFHKAQEKLIPLDSERVYEIEPNFPLDTAQIKLLFDSFQKIKKSRRIYDYTDIIMGIHHLCLTSESFVERLSKVYSYIFIDEGQDLNPVMLDITRILSTKIPVTIIADPNQSIYRFRGAEPEYLYDFANKFDSAGIFSLNFNRRCRQLINDAAMNIIELNNHRFDNDVHAIKEGGEIELIPYSEESEQLSLLLKSLQSKDDYGRSRTAIAVRENIHQMMVSHMLQEADILYHSLNGTHSLDFRLFDVIKGVLMLLINPYSSTLKYHLNKVTPATSDQIKEVINDPITRQINPSIAELHYLEIDYGPLETTKGFRKSLNQLKQIEDMIKSRSTKSYFPALFHLIEQYFWSYQLRQSEERNPKNAIYEHFFSKMAYDFFNNDKVAAENIEFLDRRRTTLETNSLAKVGLALGSFHSYKGLEADEMNLLYMDSEVIPSIRPNPNMTEELLESEIESENSLVFVGVSRAIERLNVYYNDERPSPYVNRLKEFLADYVPEKIRMPLIELNSTELVKPKEFDPSNVSSVESEKELSVLDDVNDDLMQSYSKSDAKHRGKTIEMELEVTAVEEETVAESVVEVEVEEDPRLPEEDKVKVDPAIEGIATEEVSVKNDNEPSVETMFQKGTKVSSFLSKFKVRG